MATSDSIDNSGVSMSRALDDQVAVHKHREIAQEDRISLIHKIIYGPGAFVNNLLAAAIGGMVIVLNLGPGMNPALVGLPGALPRLADAITEERAHEIRTELEQRRGTAALVPA